jgi:hypothetical protein
LKEGAGFIKLVGGISKGRPDHADLMNAREFALGLRSQLDMDETGVD